MTDKERIEHIIESIELIEKFTKGYDKDRFFNNEEIKYACYGNLIIISEAATKISEEFKQKTKKIEWSLITGFRNVIVHEYFRVDWNIVWDVIEMNLPILKQEILQVM